MTDTLPVEAAAITSSIGEEPEREHTLGSRVNGIAKYIEQLPRGDLAELRRIRQHSAQIPPEVFWRIVERYQIHPADESFWKSILPLMVKYPHVRDARPGHVLEGAGVSAARVERWLRLDQDGALREADRLFSKHKAGIDWVQFGYLLQFWDEQDRKQRNGFARDFFLSRSRRNAQSSTKGGE
jgi:hypothetical protein